MNYLSHYMRIRIDLNAWKWGQLEYELLLVFRCYMAFNVLCPCWQEILISVASDGEQKMTGCIQGVATCFEHAWKCVFWQFVWVASVRSKAIIVLYGTVNYGGWWCSWKWKGFLLHFNCCDCLLTTTADLHCWNEDNV